MSRARVVALLLIPALLGIYGYRAVIGLKAGRAYVRGVKLILQREYEDAPPFFNDAAVGFNRFISQRRSGDAAGYARSTAGRAETDDSRDRRGRGEPEPLHRRLPAPPELRTAAPSSLRDLEAGA